MRGEVGWVGTGDQVTIVSGVRSRVRIWTGDGPVSVVVGEVSGLPLALSNGQVWAEHTFCWQ
jgi:hypothetical protein